MTDQLPFAFWQSETILGTFLLTNLQDIQISSINTGRALLFWGDGTFVIIPPNGNNYTTESHVYPSLSGGQEYPIQFTPATKIKQLSVTSNFVSGANINDRATVFLNSCQNLLVAQFQNIPLTDVSFNGVYNLQTLTITESTIGMYKTQNIDLNSAISLQNLLLQSTDITTLNITGNTSLNSIDCYSDNPITAMTFNTTGNNNVGFLYVDGNNLTLDTTHVPNVFHLELTGTLGTVNLSPLITLQTFSLASTTTLPVNTIIESISVPSLTNTVDLQFYNQNTSQTSVSTGNITAGLLHGLDIRGLNDNGGDVLFSTQSADGFFDSLYNTRYINIDISTITPSSTSELIVQLDKGSSAPGTVLGTNKGPMQGGIFILGDRSGYITPWRDWADPITSYDVIAALNSLSSKRWIIATGDTSIYSGVLGTTYFYNFIGADNANPNAFLSSTDMIINGISDQNAIVGSDWIGNPSYQVDGAHSPSTNLVVSMYSSFVLPIQSTTSVSFNIWVSTDGNAATQGAVQGDITLDFHQVFDPMMIYPPELGQVFAKNPYTMPGMWHQIDWAVWQMQSGTPTAFDLGNGTSGTILFTDTPTTLIVPFSDPNVYGDFNTSPPPDGFIWLQITIQ